VTELLAEAHAVDELVPLHPLLGDVDPEPHRASTCAPVGTL
jgi:hypothetical protein